MIVWLVGFGMMVLLLVGAAALSGGRLRDSLPEIESPAITAVSALQEGVPARVHGIVAACDPLLISKLGGQSCVGYQAFIFESKVDAARGFPSV